MKQCLTITSNDYKNKISNIQTDLRAVQQGKEASNKKYVDKAALSAKYMGERDMLKLQLKFVLIPFKNKKESSRCHKKSQGLQERIGCDGAGASRSPDRTVEAATTEVQG